MTKKERAQVVELLKCAADGINSTPTPFGDAAEGLGHGPGTLVFDKAQFLACASLGGPRSGDDWPRAEYLEAAARVEEGSWSPTRTGGRR